MTTSAWHLSISHADHVAILKPRYDGRSRATRKIASAGAKRGGNLTVMPDGRIIVLDAVATHPIAPGYAHRAAEQTDHAAQQRAVAKHRVGAGYQFVPVAMEPYGPLGREATRFLGELKHVVVQSVQLTKAAIVWAAHRRISCANVHGSTRGYTTRQRSRTYVRVAVR